MINAKLNRILLILGALLIIVVVLIFKPGNLNFLEPKHEPTLFKTITIEKSEPVINKVAEEQIVIPIEDALSRITKKPFGLHVTPQSSPVSPEKFHGYHTGVDFEIKEDEDGLEIPIFVICDGPLLKKGLINGYGGVAVQSCTWEDAPVTVVYGHLKLTSVEANIGTILATGDKIGVLGKAYSSETSGERKHLHLGVSKGEAINYHGYVANKAELENWFDPLLLIK